MKLSDLLAKRGRMDRFAMAPPKYAVDKVPAMDQLFRHVLSGVQKGSTFPRLPVDILQDAYVREFRNPAVEAAIRALQEVSRGIEVREEVVEDILGNWSWLFVDVFNRLWGPMRSDVTGELLTKIPDFRSDAMQVLERLASKPVSKRQTEFEELMDRILQKKEDLAEGRLQPGEWEHTLGEALRELQRLDLQGPLTPRETAFKSYLEDLSAEPGSYVVLGRLDPKERLGKLVGVWYEPRMPLPMFHDLLEAHTWAPWEHTRTKMLEEIAQQSEAHMTLFERWREYALWPEAEEMLELFGIEPRNEPARPSRPSG